MNEYKQTLLDLQLDQVCEELRQLIKLGKILPNYDQIWRDFAKTKKGSKNKIIRGQ